MEGSWNSRGSPVPPVDQEDRGVTEDANSDRSEDSGISPGHYSCSDSSQSDRSTPATTGSLSPGSEGSSDSQPMQLSSDDASPECGFQFRTPRLDLARIMEMWSFAGSSARYQPVGLGSMDGASSAFEGGPEIWRCPTCDFTTANSQEHREHMEAHAVVNSPRVLPQFPNLAQRVNLQPSPADDGSKPSTSSGSCGSASGSEKAKPAKRVRVPRPPSQRKVKVKTFPCKQCSFVAYTKIALWKHARAHIKTEKILNCPNCPFVTEYKHHLEYHLRNHEGSKPWKCDKCTYVCVSKSMLSSHMKSHSNVYAYRCAMCPFQAKYQHALKQHLKSRNHEPGVVLNPDGTPNPDAIVDVYGTRRGPRRKRESSEASGSSVSNSPSLEVMSQTNLLPPLAANTGFNQTMGYHPLGPVSTGFPVVDAFREDSLDNITAIRTNLFVQYALAMAASRLNDNGFQGFNDGLSEGESHADAADWNMMGVDDEGSQLAAPLDLSKPGASGGSNNDDVDIQGERMAKSLSISGTNSRKGKALKTNRQALGTRASGEASNAAQASELAATGAGGANSEFMCPHCELGFANEIMYTVHMGYHGCSDPFTCKMCGHQCDDNVAFFLHIARVKHG